MFTLFLRAVSSSSYFDFEGEFFQHPVWSGGRKFGCLLSATVAVFEHFLFSVVVSVGFFFLASRWGVNYFNSLPAPPRR